MTVLIATYNSGQIIKRALQSVVSQKTSFDFEILVFDDASSDNTVEAVSNILDGQSVPWRIVQAPRNLVSEGKRILLEVLPTIYSPYIARLDHDDLWVDDLKLQRQYDLFRRYPDSVLCCTGWQIENLDGEVLEVPVIPGEGDTVSFRELASGNFICHSSVLYRTESLEKLPPNWSTVPLGDYTTWAIISDELPILVDRTISTVYVSSPNSGWMSKPRISRILDELHAVIWLSTSLRNPESQSRYLDRAKQIKEYCGKVTIGAPYYRRHRGFFASVSTLVKRITRGLSDK